MNSAQRAVLTAGAVASIGVIVVTPPVVIYSGTVLRWTESTAPALAPIADVRTIAAWLTGILLATAFLWAAVASQKAAAASINNDSRVSTIESRLEQVEALITEPAARK